MLLEIMNQNYLDSGGNLTLKCCDGWESMGSAICRLMIYRYVGYRGALYIDKVQKE
jgi:hypothetical protein